MAAGARMSTNAGSGCVGVPMTKSDPVDAGLKASLEAPLRRNPTQLSAPLRGLLTMKMIALFGLMRRGGALAHRRQFDLSELEWRIITQVAAYNPLSLNGLSELLVQDPGQLSRVVKGMVGRG